MSEPKSSSEAEEKAMRTFMETVRRESEKLQAEFKELAKRIEEDRKRLLEMLSKTTR